MRKNLSTKQIEKYSRQIVLKSVGTIGQKKILNSNVLIVGAGGLGCPIVDYLSRAGVGNIGIVDYDKVDVSNIHRQSIYTFKDVGKYKVEVLKKRLIDINPDVKIKIYKNKITKKNVYKILNKFDIIVDGSDNFKTKFLLNQFANKLKKIFIVGAISRYDGHIFAFNFKNNNEACLKCFYQSEVNEEFLNCETDGILGPVAGIVGNIQANEVLKNILGLKNELTNKILIINLLNLTFRQTRFSKKRNCICGKK
tara:strand:+ start:1542 stop:2300 length:759 start_codon:yes stop_codon:yes gene_type:complete